MKTIFLLPAYFKYVSIPLILLPVVVFIFDIQIFDDRNVQKTFFEFTVSLAFTSIIFSKYKEDDEMLQQICLRTTAYSLLVGVLLIMTKPLLNYFLWNQTNNFESAGSVIMRVMFFQA